MRFTQAFVIAITGLGVTEVVAQNRNGNRNRNSSSSVAASSTAAIDASSTSTVGNAASSTAVNQSGGSSTGGSDILIAENVQAASNSTGGANAEAGQSNSATDSANFINFCKGDTKTNGQQVTAGSCNGIVMGKIPSSGNMISSIITNPAPGDNLQANTAFNVNVQVQNLVAGVFTNPLTTYYAAPQDLQGGKVIGHTHVTIQDLGGNIATQTPPDPSKFVFFKGINDAGNGNGALSAVVTGGLPAGTYRVCTMTSAANHQPVLMPVAQRGAQDDCTKFTVGAAGNNNAGTGNGNAAGGSANGGSTGKNNVAGGSASSTAAGTATSAAAVGGTTTSAASASANSTVNAGSNGSGRNGRGGRGGRRGKYFARDFVA